MLDLVGNLVDCWFSGPAAQLMPYCRYKSGVGTTEATT